VGGGVVAGSCLGSGGGNLPPATHFRSAAAPAGRRAAEREPLAISSAARAVNCIARALHARTTQIAPPARPRAFLSRAAPPRPRRRSVRAVYSADGMERDEFVAYARDCVHRAAVLAHQQAWDEGAREQLKGVSARPRGAGAHRTARAQAAACGGGPAGAPGGWAHEASLKALRGAPPPAGASSSSPPTLPPAA
jgi:hypothetical protein